MEGESHSSSLSALAARSCSVAQRSGYVYAKSPRVRGVGARLLVWARCFDLPFRGVAAIHIGLDRERTKRSWFSASCSVPPAAMPLWHSRFSAVLLCLLVPSFGSAWTFALSLEIGRPTVGSVLTVDTILLTAAEPPFYTVCMQVS